MKDIQFNWGAIKPVKLAWSFNAGTEIEGSGVGHDEPNVSAQMAYHTNKENADVNQTPENKGKEPLDQASVLDLEQLDHSLAI